MKKNILLFYVLFFASVNLYSQKYIHVYKVYRITYNDYNKNIVDSLYADQYTDIFNECFQKYFHCKYGIFSGNYYHSKNNDTIIRYNLGIDGMINEVERKNETNINVSNEDKGFLKGVVDVFKKKSDQDTIKYDTICILGNLVFDHGYALVYLYKYHISDGAYYSLRKYWPRNFFDSNPAVTADTLINNLFKINETTYSSEFDNYLLPYTLKNYMNFKGDNCDYSCSENSLGSYSSMHKLRNYHNTGVYLIKLDDAINAANWFGNTNKYDVHNYYFLKQYIYDKEGDINRKYSDLLEYKSVKDFKKAYRIYKKNHRNIPHNKIKDRYFDQLYHLKFRLCFNYKYINTGALINTLAYYGYYNDRLHKNNANTDTLILLGRTLNNISDTVPLSKYEQKIYGNVHLDFDSLKNSLINNINNIKQCECNKNDAISYEKKGDFNKSFQLYFLNIKNNCCDKKNTHFIDTLQKKCQDQRKLLIKQYNRQIIYSDSLLKNKNYKDALSMYRKVLKNNPFSIYPQVMIDSVLIKMSKDSIKNYVGSHLYETVTNIINNEMENSSINWYPYNIEPKVIVYNDRIVVSFVMDTVTTNNKKPEEIKPKPVNKTKSGNGQKFINFSLPDLLKIKNIYIPYENYINYDTTIPKSNYPLGLYTFEGIDSWCNEICLGISKVYDSLRNLNLIKENIRINIIGGSDATPFMTVLNHNYGDEILKDIIYDENGNYKGLFIDLQNGNSDDKNYALAYLRAYYQKNIFKKAFISVLLDSISIETKVSSELGGSYRFAIPTFTFVLEKEKDSSIVKNIGEKYYGDIYEYYHDIIIPDPNRYAIVIGNENYNDVTFTEATKSSIADAKIFKKYCYNFLKIDSVPKNNNIYTIDNSKQFNSDLSDIIDNICEKAKKNPCNVDLMFYYSGYGYTDKDGDFSLVPINAESSDLQSESYKFSDICKKFYSYPFKKIIFILDASNLEKSKFNPIGNVIIFSSGAGNQRSVIDTTTSTSNINNGKFTYYILSKIKESDPTTTYEELEEYLEKEFYNESDASPQLVIPSRDIEEGWKYWKIH
jgi:hypothetical protein